MNYFAEHSRISKLRLFLLFSLFLFSIDAFGQNKKPARLNGYVRDSASGEELIGANIVIEETGAGQASNSYGFFSFTLPQGEYRITASYVGYTSVTAGIRLTSDTTLNFELAKRAAPGGRVVVSARKKENVRKVDMSTNNLSMQTIKKLPAFLGEVDLVKSVQLLPGVSTVGEGASGFNVRGGSIDQNLVLLDEAPVFNSSHLFGFFSIFNPDAVKDVQLIKGAIPANYGGRLSSILDVRMKEGNKKKFAGNGGIGTIFSRLTLEGPLVKDRASFVVAGRRSYIDVLAKPFLNGDLKDARFNFYDLTAKVNYTISPKDKVFVSGYFGNDVFSASSAFKFNWGNTTLSTRWNHVFSRKLFSNLTYYYSKYDYNLGFGDRTNSFDWKSNIFNYSLKPEFTWYANNRNTVSFGGQSIYTIFRPGRAVSKSATDTRNFSLADKFGWENALYIQNNQKIGKSLEIRYGLRWSSYNYLGKGTAYYFNDPVLPGTRKLFDTAVRYGKNESIQFYQNLEPRFGFRYQLDPNSSVKGGFNRMAQYLHLISNTTASVPLDVWTPSTNNIKPQISDQYTLGYFRNLGDNDDYEFSSEVYYKTLQNQIDYIDGADLLLNEYLEGELLSGKGRAYGAEFYVRKNTGQLTGWVSYTLAKTERKVSSINNGNWYPTRFDRRHNLYVAAVYSLNKKWEFSSSFVFSSGTPNTWPTMNYSFQGYIIPHNPDGVRNNNRLTPYHRLDIAATLQGKKHKKWSSNWVFSIYNVYGRQNAFDIFFRNNITTGNNEAIRFMVIKTPVPAVSYNFNF